MKKPKKLEVGQTVTYKRKATSKRILEFGNATGDKNIIHFNNKAAIAAGFPKGRVAHGLLIAGFAAGLISKRLSGPGSIVHALRNLEFKRPVYLNSTVDVKVEITDISATYRYKVILMAATCSVNGKVAVEGEGEVWFPLDKNQE